MSMVRPIWTVASTDRSPSTSGSETLYRPAGARTRLLRQASTVRHSTAAESQEAQLNTRRVPRMPSVITPAHADVLISKVPCGPVPSDVLGESPVKGCVTA